MNAETALRRFFGRLPNVERKTEPNPRRADGTCTLSVLQLIKALAQKLGGRKLHWTRVYERLLEYSPDDPVDRKLSSVVCDDDCPCGDTSLHIPVSLDSAEEDLGPQEQPGDDWLVGYSRPVRNSLSAIEWTAVSQEVSIADQPDNRTSVSSSLRVGGDRAAGKSDSRFFRLGLPPAAAAPSAPQPQLAHSTGSGGVIGARAPSRFFSLNDQGGDSTSVVSRLPDVLPAAVPQRHSLGPGPLDLRKLKQTLRRLSSNHSLGQGVLSGRSALLSIPCDAGVGSPLWRDCMLRLCRISALLLVLCRVSPHYRRPNHSAMEGEHKVSFAKLADRLAEEDAEEQNKPHVEVVETTRKSHHRKHSSVLDDVLMKPMQLLRSDKGIDGVSAGSEPVGLDDEFEWDGGAASMFAPPISMEGEGEEWPLSGNAHTDTPTVRLSWEDVSETVGVVDTVRVEHADDTPSHHRRASSGWLAYALTDETKAIMDDIFDRPIDHVRNRSLYYSGSSESRQHSKLVGTNANLRDEGVVKVTEEGEYVYALDIFGDYSVHMKLCIHALLGHVVDASHASADYQLYRSLSQVYLEVADSRRRLMLLQTLADTLSVAAPQSPAAPSPHASPAWSGRDLSSVGLSPLTAISRIDGFVAPRASVRGEETAPHARFVGDRRVSLTWQGVSVALRLLLRHYMGCVHAVGRRFGLLGDDDVQSEQSASGSRNMAAFLGELAGLRSLLGRIYDTFRVNPRVCRRRGKAVLSNGVYLEDLHVASPHTLLSDLHAALSRFGLVDDMPSDADRTSRYAIKAIVFQHALVAYCRILSRFVFTGVLVDPHNEFFICEIRRPYRSRRSTTSSAERMRVVFARRVNAPPPDFLASVAALVLATGQHLAILKRGGPLFCSVAAQWPVSLLPSDELEESQRSQSHTYPVACRMLGWDYVHGTFVAHLRRVDLQNRRRIQRLCAIWEDRLRASQVTQQIARSVSPGGAVFREDWVVGSPAQEAWEAADRQQPALPTSKPRYSSNRATGSLTHGQTRELVERRQLEGKRQRQDEYRRQLDEQRDIQKAHKRDEEAADAAGELPLPPGSPTAASPSVRAYYREQAERLWQDYEALKAQEERKRRRVDWRARRWANWAHQSPTVDRTTGDLIAASDTGAVDDTMLRLRGSLDGDAVVLDADQFYQSPSGTAVGNSNGSMSLSAALDSPSSPVDQSISVSSTAGMDSLASDTLVHVDESAHEADLQHITQSVAVEEITGEGSSTVETGPTTTLIDVRDPVKGGARDFKATTVADDVIDADSVTLGTRAVSNPQQTRSANSLGTAGIVAAAVEDGGITVAPAVHAVDGESQMLSLKSQRRRFFPSLLSPEVSQDPEDGLEEKSGASVESDEARNVTALLPLQFASLLQSSIRLRYGFVNSICRHWLYEACGLDLTREWLRELTCGSNATVLTKLASTVLRLINIKRRQLHRAFSQDPKEILLGESALDGVQGADASSSAVASPFSPAVGVGSPDVGCYAVVSKTRIPSQRRLQHAMDPELLQNELDGVVRHRWLQMSGLRDLNGMSQLSASTTDKGAGPVQASRGEQQMVLCSYSEASDRVHPSPAKKGDVSGAGALDAVLPLRSVLRLWFERQRWECFMKWPVILVLSKDCVRSYMRVGRMLVWMRCVLLQVDVLSRRLVMLSRMFRMRQFSAEPVATDADSPTESALSLRNTGPSGGSRMRHVMTHEEGRLRLGQVEARSAAFQSSVAQLHVLSVWRHQIRATVDAVFQFFLRHAQTISEQRWYDRNDQHGFSNSSQSAQTRTPGNTPAPESKHQGGHHVRAGRLVVGDDGFLMSVIRHERVVVAQLQDRLLFADASGAGMVRGMVENVVEAASVFAELVLYSLTHGNSSQPGASLQPDSASTKTSSSRTPGQPSQQSAGVSGGFPLSVPTFAVLRRAFKNFRRSARVLVQVLRRVARKLDLKRGLVDSPEGLVALLVQLDMQEYWK